MRQRIMALWIRRLMAPMPGMSGRVKQWPKYHAAKRRKARKLAHRMRRDRWN